tara:strand:+ start:113 stop:496 length:384 start_codon:yes stop_codon:yes gene_type:complete
MPQTISVKYTLTDEELENILEMASYGSNYWADEINYNLDETMLIEVVEGMRDKKYNITKNMIEQSIVAIAENKVEIQLHTSNRKKVFDYMTRDIWDTDPCSSIDYICDSTMADWILQCACMGDIPYG